MDDYTLKLFKLTHFNIDIQKSSATYFENSTTLDIYLNRNIFKCTNCDSEDIKVRSVVNTKIKYSLFIDNPIELILHRRKFYCKDCNKYFIEQNPIVSENRNISFITDLTILNLLKDPTITYTKAAKLTNTSATYVTKVFDSKVNLSREPLSTVVCIDEIYAKRLVEYSYCCIWYNPFTRSIIDVINNRHKQKLIDYISNYTISQRNKVKFVSIDMWLPYKEMAELAFPEALICVDSFHVVKHLNDAFNKIRIRVQKNFSYLKNDPTSYYWLYKKYFKFLLRDFSKIYSGPIKVNRFNMILTKYQIRDYMLNLSPDLALAYELKEAYRSFNLSATILDARERLFDLIDSFKQSRIHEYIEFRHTLENWSDEIVNSFNTYNGKRISNGPLERANRTIKQLFNNSFGFTNFERTRNRIMYILNDNAPIIGKKSNFTNKHKGAERGPYKK